MPKCSSALSGIRTSRVQQEMVLLHHGMTTTITCNQNERQLEHTKRMKSGECPDQQESIRTLTKRLQNRDMYIAFLEEQIKKTRSKYELKVNDVKVGANLLEQELKKVRDELQEITIKAKDIDQLELRTEILHSKLKRRNAIIAQYETQHTEIMGIINQLHLTRKMQNKESHLKTVATQTTTTTTTNQLSKAPKVFHYVSDELLSMTGNDDELEKSSQRPFACLSTALRRKFELKSEIQLNGTNAL